MARAAGFDLDELVSVHVAPADLGDYQAGAEPALWELTERCQHP